MNFSRLTLARRASRVLRVHTSHLNHRQTVGEHTCNVLQILAALIGTRRDPAALNLMLAALYHDTTEAILGDTPSTAKWRYPYLEEALKRAEDSIYDEYQIPRLEPGTLEFKLLKFADLLELGMFCTEEVKSGNLYAMTIANKAFDAIIKRGLTDVTPDAYELYLMAKTQLELLQREDT